MKEIRFDLFDLRKPPGFVFFSMQGFFLHGINYIAITKTSDLVNEECVNTFPDFAELFKNCGIDAWVIVYQAIFFAAAMIAISVFRKSEWSLDAVFNAVSVLIISVSSFTVLLSFVWAESAAIITDVYVYYFILAMALALMIFRTMTVARRRALCAKSILLFERDELRLMAIYYLLSTLYLILALDILYR